MQLKGWELLSKTEQKIFNAIADGILSNTALGDMLCCSPHTIKNHKENMKRKLSCESTIALFHLAIRSKLNE